MRSVLALMAACLLCIGGNAQNAKPADMVNDVLSTSKTYDNAWNKKDIATVDKILAPNYIYFNSEGGITMRKGTLDFLKSPKYSLTFAERTDIETYRLGDTVIVSSRWRGKGSYDRDTINDDQRCGLVFTKIGKRWNLLAEHCTQIAMK